MHIPYRFWIGCMVFFSTFSCYTIRVNLSVSIVSMTKGKTKGIPYCIKIANQTSQGGANAAEEFRLKRDIEDSRWSDESPPEIRPKEGDEEHILPDYGPRYEWDERIQGQVLGAYFYGYVLFNLLSGAIAEYFGPFKVILVVHLISIFLNAACVFAANFHWGLLLVCRFILGMGGALIYPSLQMFISYWAPPDEKGKFSSALMGNVLGTCLTWPVVGAVTMHFGWDWGFYVVSMENIVFVVVFFFVASDTPESHRWVKAEEVQYIKDKQQGVVTRKKVIAPYKEMFRNLPYWMLTICHFTNEWGLYLQLTLVPKFISDVIGYPLDTAGGLSALPPLMRMSFAFVLGALADYMLVKGSFPKVLIRKSYTVMSHIIPGIMLITIAFMGCNALEVIVLLSLSLGFNGAVVQNVLINAQDIAPNFAGSIYGLNSFFAGMGGFLVPALNAEFTQHNNGIKEWANTFILGGIMYSLGGTIWILFGSVEEQSFNRKGDP